MLRYSVAALLQYGSFIYINVNVSNRIKILLPAEMSAIYEATSK